MSAWLCGNKLLSLVCDVVKSDEFKENYNNDYSDLDDLELLTILSNINTNNLNYLYPNDDEYNILNDKEYIKLEVSDAQRWFSVRSFIYQSWDNDDNHNNELFVSLRNWSNDYREVYECETDNCEWDIDCPLN